MRKPLFYAILLLVFFGAATHRINLARQLGYYGDTGGPGFYREENAIQFRYANMAAHGIPIPSHDAKLDYPEGTDTQKSLTIFMEYAAGWSYRLFSPGISFHEYSIWFIAVVSSLAVLPAGLAGALFWKNLPAGLLTAFLYAFSLQSFDRNIGSFLFESFALPILFTGTWLFMAAMESENEKERRIKAFLAGLAMSAALVSWHFSRFYILELALAFSVALFFVQKPFREMKTALVLFMLPIAASSLVIPVLQENGGLAQPFLIVFALTAVLLFAGFSTRVNILAGVLTLAAVFLMKYATGAEGEYSHVYQTIFSMVGNLGVKPPDPTSVPVEARLMWVGALSAPPPAHVINSFLFLAAPLVLAVPNMVFSVRKEGWRGARVMFLILMALWNVEYLLMKRMGTIAVFFVSVAAGGAALSFLYGGRWGKTISAVVLVLSSACLVLNSWTYLEGNRFQKFLAEKGAWEKGAEPNSIPLWNAYNVDILSWIRSNTLHGDPIVSAMSSSGAILAYTGRPVVLHPKFETRKTRAKYEKFLTALYSDERALYEFCRSNGARYFLYEAYFSLDNGPDSYRYTADRLRPHGGEAAILMHFFPEKLKYFELAYQNAVFRIYRVTDGQATANDNIPYQPVFDPARYGISYGDMAGLDKGAAGVIRDFKSAVNSFEMAVSLADRGDPASSFGIVKNLEKSWPNLLHLNAFLCELYIMAGDRENMLEACGMEVRTTGHDPRSHKLLAEAYSLAGLDQMAGEETEKAYTLEALAQRPEWEW